MSWIERTRKERQLDVQSLTETIRRVQFDRFWLSYDQDGEDTQQMNILLPVPAGEDVYYRITMMTSQLYAARIAAQELGQFPGQRIALDQRLVSRINQIQYELFVVDNLCEEGVGLFIVLDVMGLTHDIIDKVLWDFIVSSQIPPQPKSIDPERLIERLIALRDDNKHHLFTV